MKKKKNMFFISLFFVIISIFSPIFVEAKTNDVYINHLEIKEDKKFKTLDVVYVGIAV